MTVTDGIALLPILVIILAAVLVLLAAAIRRSRQAAAWLSLAGLAASLLCLIPAARVAPRAVTGLLLVDRYSLLFTGLVVAASFVVCLFSLAYWRGRQEQREEYYLLLLTATAGGAAVVSSSHYASFFLALEILSVSFFVLAAYRRRTPASLEAGVKYLILSGGSSAFLLFGIALVYAETGTLQFAGTASALSAHLGTLSVAGIGLFLVGLGFKLSLVPFHLWSPDVFQGAPAPVAAFIATVSKGALFALLLRYAARVGLHGPSALVVALGVFSGLSMLAGNLLALRQQSVRRLLGYSSVAHMGYLLVALLAAGERGAAAAGFYLVVYFLATLGVFGAVITLSAGGGEADDLADFRSLAWSRPWLTAALTVGMLSLAGIPITGGFLGKIYLLAAGVSAGLTALVLILVAGSVIGLFYYLRVIVSLFAPPSGGGAAGARTVAGGVALAGLTAALLVLGVYPAPLASLIGAALSGLF